MPLKGGKYYSKTDRKSPHLHHSEFPIPSQHRNYVTADTAFPLHAYFRMESIELDQNTNIRYYMGPSSCFQTCLYSHVSTGYNLPPFPFSCLKFHSENIWYYITTHGSFPSSSLKFLLLVILSNPQVGKG